MSFTSQNEATTAEQAICPCGCTPEGLPLSLFAMAEMRTKHKKEEKKFLSLVHAKTTEDGTVLGLQELGLPHLFVSGFSEVAVSLLVLHLDHNNLVSIPFGLFSLVNGVIDLALHNNLLTSVPSDISRLTQLKQLRLDNNKLQSLPEELGACQQLELLHISGNVELRALPHSMDQLTKLHHLLMNDVGIKCLPYSMCECTSLEFLVYDETAIVDPPKGILSNGVVNDAVREYWRSKVSMADVIIHGDGTICSSNNSSSSRNCSDLTARKTRILITGSSGHLGHALVLHFRSTGMHEVISLDVVPSETTSHVGSIADRHFIRQCMMDGSGDSASASGGGGAIDVVLHTATLHKPHVAVRSKQDFVDINITGTLNLLEEASRVGVSAFIFTSSTTTYGDALVPPEGSPAAWIHENTVPIPKNIYGVTKTAAEDICKLFSRNNKLNVLILRTSRFFPEEDDDATRRGSFTDENLKVNEFLCRRVDIGDVVSAHVLAAEKAAELKFGTFIISSTPPPFTEEEMVLLRVEGGVEKVVSKYYPSYVAEYRRRGWSMFPTLDRVYSNALAREKLGWEPVYTFPSIIERLTAQQPHLTSSSSSSSSSSSTSSSLASSSLASSSMVFEEKAWMNPLVKIVGTKGYGF